MEDGAADVVAVDGVDGQETTTGVNDRDISGAGGDGDASIEATRSAGCCSWRWMANEVAGELVGPRHNQHAISERK
jgi:hypothetical protein